MATDYNTLISTYAQRTGRNEGDIRNALIDYLNSQKISKSQVYKQTAKGLGEDLGKGYIYDKLGGLGAGSGTLPGSTVVGTASDGGALLANGSTIPAVGSSANGGTMLADGSTLMGDGSVASESGLGGFAPYLGGATTALGGYLTYNAYNNGGKGMRTGLGTTGAGIGTMIAPGVGTIVGAVTGNLLGYGAKKLGLFHKTTAQRRQERRDKLSQDTGNSWNKFDTLNADQGTQNEVKANMEKAYANTADDYVGWYDDPETPQNEWTWVNKKAPQSGFKQNDINYQKQLGSGDIMWMPDFFENIPNWANLSMEQRDKIASKALELGTATEGGIRGNAGDLDISDDVWKNGLKAYADEVIGGDSTAKTGLTNTANTEGNTMAANNTNGGTTAFKTLTTTEEGYPIGVVGNIFFPGDGSAPVYIGNYQTAQRKQNAQLALALAKANNSKANSWGKAATAFLAPYLGLSDKTDDKKEKESTPDFDYKLLDISGDNNDNGSMYDLLDFDYGDYIGKKKSKNGLSSLLGGDDDYSNFWDISLI